MLAEISEDITHLIAESLHFQEWPECRQMLVNLLAKDEPWFHALPILTCKAVGGVHSNAIPVAAAWMTLVHAANLIDDVQDGDVIRSAQLTKPELAITIAVAWIFAAFRMLDDPCLDTETRDRITRIFARAGFDSSMGQFNEFGLDTGKSDPADQLQAYWNAVILKSGSICMAGAAAGAAAGTASTSLIEALGDYGTALGVIRQVIDDCRDIWIDSKAPENRSILPVLLHSMVADMPSPKVVDLKDNGKSSEAQRLVQAPQLLAEAGIPEIIADILLEWRRRALESLHILEPSEARDALENILEQVLTPKLHGA